MSVRTLSDYENSKTKVPDDIVARMADIYNNSLLAWWHLKATSTLGKFLPDIQMPSTSGDMAFQLIIADDQLTPAVEMVKKIFSNGKIDDNEWEGFNLSITTIENVIAKLLSAIIFVTQHYKERRA